MKKNMRMASQSASCTRLLVQRDVRILGNSRPPPHGRRPCQSFWRFSKLQFSNFLLGLRSTVEEAKRKGLNKTAHRSFWTHFKGRLQEAKLSATESVSILRKHTNHKLHNTYLNYPIRITNCLTSSMCPEDGDWLLIAWLLINVPWPELRPLSHYI